MDIKTTKQRFEEHWSYDWIKYLAILAAVIVFFSALYTMTARRLADFEQLEIGVYCYNYNIEKATAFSEAALEEFKDKDANPELKNVLISPYTYHNEAQEYADSVKWDAEMLDVKTDVFILPSMTEYRVAEDDTLPIEEQTFVANVKYKYSNQSVCGRGLFITIDDLIAQEKASENPARVSRATRLESILSTYDPEELYANYTRFYVKSVEEPPIYFDEDKVGEDYVAKNWGLNLNVLDTEKLFQIFSGLGEGGEGEANFVLSVRKESGDITDAVEFIIWLFENFAK